MKIIIAFFASLIILLVACNNQSDSSQNKTAIPLAEQNIRDEITKYPDSFNLKEKLVQYFRENGNYTTAIVETDRILLKDSTNSRLLYIKAMLYSENEDTTKAIKAWEKLVAIEPSPENLISLGTLYAFTKNPATITLADDLLKLPNAQPQALFLKGLFYSNVNDKIKAVGFFDNCISLDYSYLFAYREKALCQYDSGKYLDALKTLELAITVNKTYEEAYYWMGKCFEKLNKKEQAIQNYQLAIQFDPNYIEAKDALGKLGVTP
jgi:tetratricopeptide (TPR) repeat protein